MGANRGRRPRRRARAGHRTRARLGRSPTGNCLGDHPRIPLETRIVRGSDVGDSYNYAPPDDDVLVDAPSEERLETLADSPAPPLDVLHRTYEWDGKHVETQTHFERRAGEPFVRIRVDFENPCEDQRVRVHIRMKEPADVRSREGQFAVVERGHEPEGGYGEVPLPTYPAGAFVSAGGTSLLLDHVTEYELVGRRARDHDPPFDRTDQPLRTTVARGSRRPGAADPRLPDARPLVVPARVLPRRRRRPRAGRALSPPLAGGERHRPRRRAPGDTTGPPSRRSSRDPDRSAAR